MVEDYENCSISSDQLTNSINLLVNEMEMLIDGIDNSITIYNELNECEETIKSQETYELFQKGIEQFNLTNSLSILLENDLLESCSDIAKFLFNTTELSRRSIGEYLSKNDEFNKNVLSDYAKLFKFNLMTHIDALRVFLKAFLLPGESQQVERILESFAISFTSQNKSYYISKDLCHSLSYAILMLHTSLFNKVALRSTIPLTLNRFIEMIRGIKDADSLTDDYIREIYFAVKSKEFKYPLDVNENLIFSGYLWKQGNKYRAFRKRWCKIADGKLYYYNNMNEKELRGYINLINMKIRCYEGIIFPSIISFYFHRSTIMTDDEIFDDSTILSSNISNEIRSNSRTQLYIELISFEDGEKLNGMKDGKFFSSNFYKFQAKSITERNEWIKHLKNNIIIDPNILITNNDFNSSKSIRDNQNNYQVEDNNILDLIDINYSLNDTTQNLYFNEDIASPLSLDSSIELNNSLILKQRHYQPFKYLTKPQKTVQTSNNQQKIVNNSNSIENLNNIDGELMEIKSLEQNENDTKLNVTSSQKKKKKNDFNNGINDLSPSNFDTSLITGNILVYDNSTGNE